MTEKGFSANFNKNKCIVTKNNTVYLEVISNNNSLSKLLLKKMEAKTIRTLILHILAITIFPLIYGTSQF